MERVVMERAIETRPLTTKQGPGGVLATERDSPTFTTALHPKKGGKN